MWAYGFVFVLASASPRQLCFRRNSTSPQINPLTMDSPHARKRSLRPALSPRRPHDTAFSMVFCADAVESVCFPLGVPFDAVVAAAPAAGSNVSSGKATERMEPKRELSQLPFS